MLTFVAIRNAIYPIQSKSIEERIKTLEEANEELLKDINDLSEGTRNNLRTFISLFPKCQNSKDWKINRETR